MVKSLINLSICGTRIGYLVMRVILIAVPKEETTSRITQVIFLRKTSAQQNQKFGAIVFSVEEGSWKCGACMVLKHKGGTKCAACETEQPGNERKLDVSVGADGSEALAYSRIGAGGFKFVGLRLQGQPDRSAVITIFEDLFIEEGTGS